MKLEGRSVIITGAGRGLGRAIALAVSREGAGVTIMSRSGDELKAVAREMPDSAAEPLIVEGDVARSEEVSDLVNRSTERFSKVDVLVNNAAVIGPSRFLEDADVESWKRTIDINLSGAFFCARSAAPVMAESGGGRIINISSGLGRIPFPRFCAYSVSKAGIIQLTRSLSEELKPLNIQVNAIDPGVMDTSMQEEIRALGASVLGESVYERFVEYKNAGALKNPAEVASLVVYLASREGASLSGHFGTLDDYARLGWRQ